eukprot:Unigene12692_Nuclearia_a/m.38542 Unigene12692_Nuclearia_a/g.38542  ORF Unigene12692_Nuclearia_a/g.38542 Unigene12692_Nuclearia_a/m.38542 type:complete len:304 (+) Unigene12692_Nuclearia_a:294-1205(+)
MARERAEDVHRVEVDRRDHDARLDRPQVRQAAAHDLAKPPGQAERRQLVGHHNEPAEPDSNVPRVLVAEHVVPRERLRQQQHNDAQQRDERRVDAGRKRRHPQQQAPAQRHCQLPLAARRRAEAQQLEPHVLAHGLDVDRRARGEAHRHRQQRKRRERRRPRAQQPLREAKVDAKDLERLLAHDRVGGHACLEHGRGDQVGVRADEYEVLPAAANRVLVRQRAERLADRDDDSHDDRAARRVGRHDRPEHHLRHAHGKAKPDKRATQVLDQQQREAPPKAGDLDGPPELVRREHEPDGAVGEA